MNSFSWTTPEYEFRAKKPDWYWMVGIITAALVIAAILFGNYLFGIVLATGAFTLTLFSSREPKMVKVSISEKGVRVDKLLYPYHSLVSFGLDEEHHTGAKFFIKPKKLAPVVSVPVADVDTDELRRFLLTKIKEEHFEEHFMHTIFERLGF